MDRFSNLPINIIEAILCLLSIQEAVRTSILSRDWRYRWTKIPKLVFSEKKFKVSTEETQLSSILEQSCEDPSKRQNMNKKSKLIYDICQVLLMHDGPLSEFNLSLLPDVSLAKIDHIMFNLSKKNTVNTLKLKFHCMRYTLPYSVFSFRKLTQLRLSDCTFNHQPIFSGFPSLITLFMDGVCIPKATLIHLLSKCPLLKTLDIKSLTFPGRDRSTITDLFECLPVIEQLSISFDIIESFLRDRDPRELPTALNHLKRLRIDVVQFPYKDVLSILLLVIKSSPKLEKLTVLDGYWDMKSRRSDSSTPEDYSDVEFKHLNELKIIIVYRNRKNQLDFVELILAKSPVLKKVRIFLRQKVSERDKSQISRTLMGYPCASPDVQIIFDKKE